MIDYLERLFVPEKRVEERESETGFRFASLGEEGAEEMILPRLAPEEPWEGGQAREHLLPELHVPFRRPESIPPEELARVIRRGEEPVFERQSPRISQRPQARERQEELERRLRRDSRRYDSGFFWY